MKNIIYPLKNNGNVSLNKNVIYSCEHPTLPNFSRIKPSKVGTKGYLSRDIKNENKGSQGQPDTFI